MRKNIYFLHIPKTAGRFFYYNILDPLESLLNRSGVEIDIKGNSGFNAHQLWCTSLITDDTYIISIMRDPVEQLVSLYCHLFGMSPNGLRVGEPGSKMVSRERFLEWVAAKGPAIQDYQSKNFLVERSELVVDNRTDDEFKAIKIDEKKVISRIKRTNLLIRSSDLTDANVLKLREKLLLDFGIDYESVSPTIKHNPEFTNEDSANLYRMLTPEDILELYKINPLDKKIYDNDSYFWVP